MTREHFDELFSAYLVGACSRTQLESLLAFIKAPENRDWVAVRIREQLAGNQQHNALRDEAQLTQLQKALDQNLQQIFHHIDQQKQQKQSKLPFTFPGFTRRLSRQKWIMGAAAAVTLFAGVFWWNHEAKKAPPSTQTAQIHPDFKPGKNAAVLTVDGGEQIYLDSNTSGSIARQGNSAITSSNGQIRYITEHPEEKTIYNTLSTSNGNQYSLVLPDGTKVWLNAASSIRYPVAFNGATREVQAEGELYFEVKHNDKQPFIVKAGNQVIEDIGTSFNVHAYSDELSFSTTLLEGTVKVAGTTLKPGMQAHIKAGKLSVRPVDTAEVVAWKNGLFAFHQTPVKEVMRQIARWYNVEVAYQGQIPSMRFGGKISRNSNASVVLTILKKSGLVFTVQDHKIIVTGANQP